MGYEFMSPYYDEPTQVRYYDLEKKRYVGGIGFHNWLVGGNGFHVPIDEYIAKVCQVKPDMDPDSVLIEMEWLDISEAIYIASYKDFKALH